MQSLHATLKYAARVGIYYEWHRVLFWANALLNMKGMAYTVNFIREAVETRMNKPSLSLPIDGVVPEDFITRFQRLQRESQGKLTNDDIWIGCTANIGAGSDTTAVSLSSAIYLLYNHPDVLSKARKEIDEAQSRGELSVSITFKEAQRLPYLQAVIKESLRVHPATGLPFGRIVPPGGANIVGQWFPAGVCHWSISSLAYVQADHVYQTTVGINAWVAHRNRDVFGDDADVFRPERWLESPDIVKRRDAYFMTVSSSQDLLLRHDLPDPSQDGTLLTIFIST